MCRKAYAFACGNLASHTSQTQQKLGNLAKFTCTVYGAFKFDSRVCCQPGEPVSNRMFSGCFGANAPSAR
jgi:hypothetical protein